MNKKSIFLTIFLMMSFIPALLADTQDQNANYDQARQNYRTYLEQLKTLSQQYSQVTGQMKQFLKEEGVPQWNENTGEISVQPYVEPVSATNNSVLDKAQVQETDKDMTVSVDLPGAKKDSIKVSIQDGKLLHITAARKIQNTDQAIEKLIALPVPAQERGTRAKYEDGVLTITILKAAKKEVVVPVN